MDSLGILEITLWQVLSTSLHHRASSDAQHHWPKQLKQLSVARGLYHEAPFLLIHPWRWWTEGDERLYTHKYNDGFLNKTWSLESKLQAG